MSLFAESQRCTNSGRYSVVSSISRTVMAFLTNDRDLPRHGWLAC